MSRNRLPNALPTVPEQLDLNAPGAVDKLFYGEREATIERAERPIAAPAAPPATDAAPNTAPPTRNRATRKSEASPAAADTFSATLERLKALGPRGERPHHVHLPDELDLALRRYAADRKTKATNVLIVALMQYLDARSGG